VVDLAVGIVIGVAFTGVVQGLVRDQYRFSLVASNGRPACVVKVILAKIVSHFLSTWQAPRPSSDAARYPATGDANAAGSVPVAGRQHSTCLIALTSRHARVLLSDLEDRQA
jgi:hypothetical protein